VIRFEELTTFVGANGSGKTAALVALQKMFGTTNAQRALAKEDFHVAPNLVDPDELSLELEARFSFPELLDDADASTSAAVPECLRHILATTEGDAPLCRIRMRAVWRKTASADGDVEQQLEWIDSMADAPAETALHPLRAWERSLIQVFYVPASRDAARELRFASGTILSRALDHVDWSQATRDKTVELTHELASGLRAEAGFVAFETHLRSYWSSLHGTKLGSPELSLAEADLATVLRRLDARLVGGVSSLPIALLSEGERSLLYFALVVASLKFEAETIAGAVPAASTSSPVLTILAVEEPENHLAPYYLSRILNSLRGVTRAQVALTSHSASILRRVRPEEVRHFRITRDGARVVSEIALPVGNDEALKYVREAVQAHPELYFASTVVLGEGASEEIVLPRVARALGVDVDPQFIAIVPLGGRHVHHMWRLLRALGTPYATLVDLDMERHEGGWMRLHGLTRNLLEAGEKREDVRGELSDADFDMLRTRPAAGTTDDTLKAYLAHLELRFNVFLSAPLDLDLVCLRAFEATYKKLLPKRRGPRIPTDDALRAAYLTAAAKTVLGSVRLAGTDNTDDVDDADASDEDADEAASTGGSDAPPRGATYDDQLRALFPWYRYLFLSGSKPVAHARALAMLDDETVAASCPDILRRLVVRIRDLADDHHA
jgi:putative ATP-dependent endonuclease of OLD family